MTSTNSLSAVGKAFNFRMHPNGVAHLIKAGFNVISTANNHAIDYGARGMRHTLKHMAELKPKGLVASHGIAATREAMFEPARFEKKGASFAFSALGIGGRAANRCIAGASAFSIARRL